MTGGDSGPNNPLSPYYPSETPSMEGNGRRWFVLLLVLLFLAGVLYQFVSVLL